MDSFSSFSHNRSCSFQFVCETIAERVTSICDSDTSNNPCYHHETYPGGSIRSLLRREAQGDVYPFLLSFFHQHVYLMAFFEEAAIRVIVAGVSFLSSWYRLNSFGSK
ncbi:MAG: hypothetical protein EA360_11810 [Balneolaceae bacterium]|nr:MAG: hypothetical protein EA360_11810 [Balneolaceae bacterium]